MNHLHLSDTVLLQIRNSLEDDSNFELPQECKDALLDHFNIKIQPVEHGFTCFKGVDIGSSVQARSSGLVFALYLKSKGLKAKDIVTNQDIEKVL